jgi:hypothetical protein
MLTLYNSIFAYEFDEYSEIEITVANLKLLFDQFEIPLTVDPSKFNFITKEMIAE